MKVILSLLLGLGVPKWAIAMVLASGVSWLAPKVIDQIQKDKARRVVRAARLEPEPERQAADRKALELAGDDVQVLVLVATEALEHGRTGLADSALSRLRRLGVPERSLVTLDDARHGPLPALAAQSVMRAERLLEREQLDAARLLIDRSVRRWPTDPELLDLRVRLRTVEDGVDGSDDPDAVV